MCTSCSTNGLMSAYLIVLPVLSLIHCGIGLFCFCALASFCFVRKDLWLCGSILISLSSFLFTQRGFVEGGCRDCAMDFERATLKEKKRMGSIFIPASWTTVVDLEVVARYVVVGLLFRSYRLAHKSSGRESRSPQFSRYRGSWHDGCDKYDKR